MIKRDNVVIMNARTKGVAIAKENIEVCKKKQYISPSGTTIDLSQELDSALNGTVYYAPDDDLPNTDWETSTPVIEVTNETTTQAAVRLASLGKTNLIALNFASARNQGGGFLSGAVAQEEDLCRASGLYSCLKKKPLFYNANILCDNTYYTDGVIYSPNVPFFRDEHNLFMEKPFSLSIVTAPAPNLRGIQDQDINKQQVAKILVNRMDRVLKVAASHGHKNIILGAWGCGAFGNNPADVAELFKSALIVTPAFEHVTFAVYDTRTPTVLYDTFNNIIKNI